MTAKGVGARLPRKEDRRFLHGQGEYVANLRFAGMLEVAFVRSPMAHGKIKQIKKPAGHEDSVFTSADLLGVKPIRAVSALKGFKASEQPVLASKKVRQVGELVAMCVASTRAQAEDLADLVELDLEELPAVVDMLEARTNPPALVHEEWGDNLFLESLVDREHTLAAGFTALLDTPVDLLALARSAIHEGDDLHNRLSSATTLLHALLATRRTDSESAKAALHTVAKAPLYFLNLWMPTCQLMLLAAEGERGSSLVTRLCANGEEIGIQVAGLPDQWFTAPASLVQGPFMKGAPENPQLPPATGDSGVIDAFGLGGQGLRHAPSLRAAFSEWLTADDDARARGILAGMHPILETPFALDAAAVAKSGRAPLLSTGMVSADGRGLLGRGICAVPVQPFADAVARLAY